MINRKRKKLKKNSNLAPDESLKKQIVNGRLEHEQKKIKKKRKEQLNLNAKGNMSEPIGIEPATHRIRTKWNPKTMTSTPRETCLSQ